MQQYAKLIHKAHINFLPTRLPAHFYGLPNGNVIIIYSRFYGNPINQGSVEFVFAVHEEFGYEYQTEQLMYIDQTSDYPVFNEMVDKPDPKFNILSVYRNIENYSQAYLKLNEDVKNILSNLETDG